MAKPHPVDVTEDDDNHPPKRKFKCGKNSFRLIGDHFDDDAKIVLNDPTGAANWANPPDTVKSVKSGLEFRIEAHCTCPKSTFLGFFARLLWPLLWLLGLVKRKHFGIGGLTITVTNDSGEETPLSISNVTYE
jgi:hypothetical protein